MRTSCAEEMVISILKEGFVLSEEEVESMTYAPVLITTLNRINHLKDCMDSLLKNSLSQYTDFYISVDYPPSEKYEAGYLLVKKYVSTLALENSNVHAFFQDKNLGAHNNSMFLKKIVSGKYDRYIFTEDDNVFAANFLEYINWGLKNFEADNDVIAICGYSQNIQWRDRSRDAYLIKRDFNAWGYGTWTRKMKRVDKAIVEGALDAKLHSPRGLLKLFFNRADLCYYALQYLCRSKPVMVCDGKLSSMDITKSMYLILFHKFIIMPTITKVNNMGYDGSGVNCALVDMVQQDMDQNEHWHSREACDLLYDKKNDDELRKMFFAEKVKGLKRKVRNQYLKKRVKR